jgi:futalosine hydrolase
MPKILLVAATVAEIAPSLELFSIPVNADRGLFLTSNGRQDVMAVLTGVGMVNTAFELGKLIGSHFDVVINAGLAGGFVQFQPGDVVNVHQDCFSELGAEDDKRFMSIDEMGFGSQHLALHNLFENEYSKNLPKSNGITVNTVHGNEKSIQRVIEKFQPHVETMEGAAFIHAANAFNWRAIQLRAISNQVEKRNRDNWNIALAVQNLNKVVVDLARSINPDLK